MGALKILSPSFQDFRWKTIVKIKEVTGKHVVINEKSKVVKAKNVNIT